MTRMNKTRRALSHGLAALTVTGLLAAAPTRACAEPILAITTGNALLSFDSATPGTTSVVLISGIGGDQIIGIDVRPATRQLYGLSSTSNLYVIDALTGNAALVGMLGTPLNGGSFGVDFNPTVDRLRVTSDADQHAGRPAGARARRLGTRAGDDGALWCGSAGGHSAPSPHRALSADRWEEGARAVGGARLEPRTLNPEP